MMFLLIENAPKSQRLIYQNEIIEGLHAFIEQHSLVDFVTFFQVTVKILLLAALVWLFDKLTHLVFRYLVHPFFIHRSAFYNRLWVERVILRKLLLFFSIGFIYYFAPYLFYHHPKSFSIIENISQILLIIVISQIIFRVIDNIDIFYDEKLGHQAVAVKTYAQFLKLIVGLISGYIILSMLFGIQIDKILTYITAITALVLLVFRDTILGFVAGVQIANNKLIKEGDFIKISKYNIEGTVKSINIGTTLIQNADKSVSSIPTYDLIAGEVVNFETLRKGNIRRIKRPVIIDPTSIKFLTEEELQLIVQNLSKAGVSFEVDASLPQPVSNLSLFRLYTEKFIKSLGVISEKDLFLVRVLETTPTGCPMEVYCYVKKFNFEEFEKIQTHIFEHLLTVAPYFQLKIAYNH